MSKRNEIETGQRSSDHRKSGRTALTKHTAEYEDFRWVFIAYFARIASLASPQMFCLVCRKQNETFVYIKQWLPKICAKTQSIKIPKIPVKINKKQGKNRSIQQKECDQKYADNTAVAPLQDKETEEKHTTLLPYSMYYAHKNTQEIKRFLKVVNKHAFLLQQ